MDVLGVLGMSLVVFVICLASAALAGPLKLETALLPLPLLGAVVVWLLLWGFAGLLLPGVWIALLLLAALSVWQISVQKKRIVEAFCSPGLIFFAGAGLFVIVLFGILQPMFIQWDEFTFWGVACKIVKTEDMLFPAAPGNLAARTYLPGMMLVSYLFQCFGRSFSEWQCLAAYDILFFAAMAAAAGLPKKRWAAAALICGGAFVLPFFFTSPQPGAASILYRNAMGDLPLAMLFGGALCVYFGSGRSRAGLTATGCVLCLLTLTKDMGFAYALIGVGVVFLDGCLARQRLGLRTTLCALRTAVLLALPVAALFMGWSKYCAVVIHVDRNSVGSGGVTYAGILAGGLAQLLGIGRTELYASLMQSMAQAFFTVRVCLLGSGVVALGIIFAVSALAFVTAPRGEQRRRVAVVTLGLTAAFAAFYLFHLFLYYYNFAEVEALALKDYDRYISPYYQGWLLAALCLLGRSVAQGPMPRLSRVSLTGVCVCLGAVFLWRGCAVNNFWNDGDSLYQVRLDVAADAAAANQVLTQEDRVLVLSQGDDSTRWYYYNYELNATVQYGFGGYAGTLEDQSERWDSTFMNLVESLNWTLYDYQAVCIPEGLIQYLREKECNYLLVDRTDDYLVKEFSYMFEGGLRLNQPATLYRVEDRGGTDMTFTIAAEASR